MNYSEQNKKPIRLKRFHDWLIKVAISEKYWGKMEKKNINPDKRTIYCGFYGLGYHLLDPQPQMAISLLRMFYGYKCKQIIIDIVHNFNKHDA